MSMPLREFMGRCHFYERNGRLHGSCVIRRRNGELLTIATRPGGGIPVSLLATKIAQAELPDGDVSGLFDSVWKGAKSAATSVAKKAVSKDLLAKATQIASSDLGMAALSFVPGGTTALTAVKLGTQAANLLGKASSGPPAAKADAQKQIMAITTKAAMGSPVAKQAQNILKAVHAKGKAKGVFPSKTTGKVVVKPGLPAAIPRPGIIRTPAAAAPSVRTLPRFLSSPAHRRQGTYWDGVRGFLQSVGGEEFDVGHWSQWNYD